MKIYFAASIRGGRDDIGLYLQIINHLKKYGEVLTEHIGDKKLASETHLSDRQIHDRDLGLILEADAVVAEVSTPSLGVGYEISKAVEHGKRVLCLYRPQEGKKLSAMIAGCPEVVNAEYKALEEAKKAIDDFLK